MSSALNTKSRSGRPAGAGGKCSMFSASHKQCLQNRGETSSGPMLKPRPQPGDACGIPESAPQMKLPLCHKCRATAALALSAKPQGMISFERERCIHQDFTAEVPSLSPSPSAAQVACECCGTSTPSAFCARVRRCMQHMQLTLGVCGWWHSPQLRWCKTAEAQGCSAEMLTPHTCSNSKCTHRDMEQKRLERGAKGVETLEVAL